MKPPESAYSAPYYFPMWNITKNQDINHQSSTTYKPSIFASLKPSMGFKTVTLFCIAAEEASTEPLGL